MTTKQTCPVCELEQPQDREPLTYFAQGQLRCAKADDIGDLYEDTERVLQFLGAVAQAMRSEEEEEEDGERFLPWLAEELAKETQRRLERMRKAGISWEKKAGKSYKA